jgi:predicted 3-demethylubiquinone-9 3-methyltransferase (glyoxalase superfamily)
MDLLARAEERTMPTARITPCLWFDHQAEEAARFYVSVFRHSRITAISRYGTAGQDVHGRPPGSVMTVAFELDGQPFTALNGGPAFTFNEAVSLQVPCADQQEIDYFWDRLGAGGDPRAQQCGWLKDKFGLSWQIVPAMLPALLADQQSAGAQRAMEALLRMKKIEIGQLQAVANEPETLRTPPRP